MVALVCFMLGNELLSMATGSSHFILISFDFSFDPVVTMKLLSLFVYVIVVLRAYCSVKYWSISLWLFVIYCQSVSVCCWQGYLFFLNRSLWIGKNSHFNWVMITPWVLACFGGIGKMLDSLRLGRRQDLMMVLLELLEPIFEFEEIETVVRIEVAEFEILGDFFFLLEYFLNFSSTTPKLIHSLFH